VECVNKCDYLLFGNGKFYCKLYEESLLATKELSIDDPDNLRVTRCEKCIKEELIGSNTVAEFVRKAKQELGWMGDSIYSMKDDIEEGMTRIYQFLKDLEENEIKKIQNS